MINKCRCTERQGSVCSLADAAIHQSHQSMIYVPALAYDHKLWVVTKRIRPMQAAEMIFLWRLSGLFHGDRTQCRAATPLFWKMPAEVTRIPSGPLLDEMFCACPTSKSPWGSPRTCWRDYIWEQLSLHQKSWWSKVCASLRRLLFIHTRMDGNKWMDLLKKTSATF